MAGKSECGKGKEESHRKKESEKYRYNYCIKQIYLRKVSCHIDNSLFFALHK